MRFWWSDGCQLEQGRSVLRQMVAAWGQERPAIIPAGVAAVQNSCHRCRTESRACLTRTLPSLPDHLSEGNQDQDALCLKHQAVAPAWALNNTAGKPQEKHMAHGYNQLNRGLEYSPLVVVLPSRRASTSGNVSNACPAVRLTPDWRAALRRSSRCWRSCQFSLCKSSCFEVVLSARPGLVARSGSPSGGESVMRGLAKLGALRLHTWALPGLACRLGRSCWAQSGGGKKKKKTLPGDTAGVCRGSWSHAPQACITLNDWHAGLMGRTMRGSPPWGPEVEDLVPWLPSVHGWSSRCSHVDMPAGRCVGARTCMGASVQPCSAGYASQTGPACLQGVTACPEASPWVMGVPLGAHWTR